MQPLRFHWKTIKCTKKNERYTVYVNGGGATLDIILSRHFVINKWSPWNIEIIIKPQIKKIRYATQSSKRYGYSIHGIVYDIYRNYKTTNMAMMGAEAIACKIVYDLEDNFYRLARDVEPTGNL